MMRSKSSGRADSRAKGHNHRDKSNRVEVLPEPGGDRIKEKRLDIFIVVLLLCFGLYHSVLYFGHQVVPNSDFPCFVSVSRELLSFQLPSSYKRAPVVGLLQAGLSYFVGGQHPDLTAGRLLNAILHPFNIVLLWLIGKRIVGRGALWIAIIGAINPWVIQMLTEPIAETTLLFFVLVTFYFIVRRSKWSYLFASIATMVRYEGAALILGAFVMDMLSSENKKERFWAFGYAAAATVPLALWMLGTVLNWQSQGGTYYLKGMGARSGGKVVLLEYINLVWRIGFYPLFLPGPKMSEKTADFLMGLSKILVGAGFVFGVVYGLCKRRWGILAFLIFLLPYLVIHAIHGSVIGRYCVPIGWMVLLICFYGLQSGWRLIDKGGRVPRVVVIILQGVLLIFAVVWLVQFVPYLGRIAAASRRSVSMPYVAMGVVGVVFAGRRFVEKMRYCWRDIAIAAVVCGMIVCNQFLLVRVMGDGQRDVEFKLLADWYIANAKPGEKLVSSMAGVVRIFAPKYEDYLVHMSNIRAESPTDFVSKCYEENITYVTWDSRIGLSPNDMYYKNWGIENIAMLGRAQNIGPYEFITTVRANKRRFVNIFRLRRPQLPSSPGRD